MYNSALIKREIVYCFLFFFLLEEVEERDGFKNSLELQDEFDSERKILSNTYNSIVEFPLFYSSFLRFFWRRWKKKGERRI